MNNDPRIRVRIGGIAIRVEGHRVAAILEGSGWLAVIGQPEGAPVDQVLGTDQGFWRRADDRERSWRRGSLGLSIFGPGISAHRYLRSSGAWWGQRFFSGRLAAHFNPFHALDRVRWRIWLAGYLWPEEEGAQTRSQQAAEHQHGYKQGNNEAALATAFS